MLFFFRVKLPELERYPGIATIALAIPVAIAGISNLLSKRTALFWVPPFIYLVWSIMALTVDYLFKIEFRSPAKPLVLVPFLVLFYSSIGGMALSMWRVNFYMWLLSGITSVLNIYGSIYAAWHGKM